jgi:ABC-2 type transport system permease protein
MSAAAVQQQLASGAMPTRRLIGAYVAEAKYETLRMLRTPVFAILFIGLPGMLYLLFAVLIFGSALRTDRQAGAFVFTAFSIVGMMGPGMFGFGTAVAIERDQGLLKLKRALPMPPASYLLSKMFMTVIFAVIIMGTMIALVPFSHLKLTPGQAFSVIAINILGSLPFAAIGLFIGVWTTSRTAPAFVNITYQVMMHISGLFYPMPKMLHDLAPIWPTYHLQQLVLGATGARSEGSPLVHAAMLTAVTCALTIVSVRRLDRTG